MQVGFLIYIKRLTVGQYRLIKNIRKTQTIKNCKISNKLLNAQCQNQYLNASEEGNKIAHKFF